MTLPRVEESWREECVFSTEDEIGLKGDEDDIYVTTVNASLFDLRENFAEFDEQIKPFNKKLSLERARELTKIVISVVIDDFFIFINTA